MNNNKNKQVIFSIIGIAILCIAVVGVTFAFFNYTRTGNTNTVQAGRIVFNTTQGDAINLSNAFPITSAQAQTDTTNAKTLAVTVTGDTSYEGGIEYLVTATDVHMTTTTGKNVPVTIEVGVTGNNSKTLGTSDDDYYTNRGGNTSIYKLEYDGSLNENDHILVGYIAPDTNQTGVDGIINIKAYLNDADILISDTYNDGNEPTDEKGTPASLGEGKTVFTTTEWNSLKGNNALSFKIKVEAREGTWVEEAFSINAMNTFPSIITDEKANIKEVYFNKMSESEMNARYNNSTIKADLTYNNEGKVLAWLEENEIDNTKYNLIVASDGKTYFPSVIGALFAGYSNLQNIEFNNVDMSRVTRMYSMFYNCSKLVSVNMNGLGSNSLTDLGGIFYGCNNLVSIYMRNFNFGTSHMSGIFNIESVETIDITNAITSNVQDFSGMFADAHSLANIIGLNTIDTSNATNMSAMFRGLTNIRILDLSSFNTNKVTNMSLMFAMQNYRNYNPLPNILEKIYVSNFWTVNNVTYSNEMFYNCTSLVGTAPNRTYSFDSSKYDKNMAVIATDTSEGYLTNISLKPTT